MMAISNNAGFSNGALRSGAALPTDLGAALSQQLVRLTRKLGRRVVQPNFDRLSGPSLEQLEPGLASELRTMRRM